MYVIVGLGNPTKEYEGTRHNIGFSMVDMLSNEYDISVIERKHKAIIGKGYIDGTRVILAKPQTYMNLSGESVRELVDYYKIDPTSELLVIFDDVCLNVGQLRIRKKGSAGGHNGIKSIISSLNTQEFARIKVGVGEKPKGYDLADYVLGHFTKAEKAVYSDTEKDLAQCVKLMISGRIDEAMNCYNKKKEE